MKAIIVEDELIIAEHLKTILNNNGIEVIKITTDIDYIECQSEIKPDFYILDINLCQEINGIEIAENLTKKKIPFVFITANNELETLKRAIKTNPISYITKPFKERDIIAIIELLKLKIINQPSITLILPNGNEELFEEDILFCKANGSYTEITTINKTYVQRINLKDILKKLSSDFIRVHRSYVVNKTKIQVQKTTYVKILDHIIPISNKHKE